MNGFSNVYKRPMFRVKDGSHLPVVVIELWQLVEIKSGINVDKRFACDIQASVI